MTTRARAKKKLKVGDVSVRGATYDRLREYCRKHNVQMRSVVDDLLVKALDEAQKKEN